MIGSYMLEDSSPIPILCIFSVILILVAFFFKMSLAPFHAWLADVYHGAPVYASLFIGSASKIAICGLLIRAIYSLFDNLHLEMQTLLIVVALLSIFVGAIGAIMQEDLRRILAYSSIGNMGFAIAAIATGSAHGIASGFIYVTLYSLLMFIPSFVLISLLASAKHKDDPTILLCDLRELNISNPYKTAALVFVMLSTAGLPPFAGFFGKFFILMNIIAQDMQMLSILFVIGAILSSVYCIKIVKNIYFTSIDFNCIIPTTSLQCRFEVMLITLVCFGNIIYCLYASDAVAFISGLFRDYL
jgi:NADH-quinone oxidoreductase subunit N